MRERQSGHALMRRHAGEAIKGANSRTFSTRSAILKAARDAILHKGYEATRIEGIAKHAGISRPTFYRHFKDKSDFSNNYQSEIFERSRMTGGSK